MAITREWVKLPSRWINEGALSKLKWSKDGSAATAALMLLVVFAHIADEITGVSKATYSYLQDATQLSRTKIAEGLAILERENVVKRLTDTRSTYQLVQYGEAPWGKLPAKGLYREETIRVFRDFSLRNRAELWALKIFLLLVAKRNGATNLAAISYDNIEQHTGENRSRIRRALNLLVLHNLVHVERIQRDDRQGYFNAYRISHVEPYRHMGTSGRLQTIDEVEL